MPYPVVTCHNCNGSGQVSGVYRDVTCPRCEGTGHNNTGEYAGCWYCRECDGKKTIQKYFSDETATCGMCHGKGEILGDWVEPEDTKSETHYWRGKCKNEDCAHGRVLIDGEWETCPTCGGTGECD